MTEPIVVNTKYMPYIGSYIAIHEQRDALDRWRVIWQCHHGVRYGKHTTSDEALACGRWALRAREGLARSATRLRYEVYSGEGEYLASFKWGEDAAVLASAHGGAATIRTGYGALLWIEGSEGWPAVKSHRTSDILQRREYAIQSDCYDRRLANDGSSLAKAALFAREQYPTTGEES
jgi:hypothetical protein